MIVNVIFQFGANGTGYAIAVLTAYLLPSESYVQYTLACSLGFLAVNILELGCAQSLVAHRELCKENKWFLLYRAYAGYVLGLMSVLSLAILSLWVIDRSPSYLVWWGVCGILLIVRLINIHFHSSRVWKKFRILNVAPNVMRLLVVLISYLAVSSENLYQAIGIAQAIACGLIAPFVWIYWRRVPVGGDLTRQNFSQLVSFFLSSGWKYFVGIVLVSLIIRAEQVWIARITEPDIAAGLLAIIALGSMVSVVSTAVMQFLLVNSSRVDTKDKVSIALLVLIGLLTTAAAYFFGEVIIGAIYPDHFVAVAPFFWIVLLSHTVGLITIAFETKVLQFIPRIYVLAKAAELAIVAAAAPLAAVYVDLWYFFVVIVFGRLLSGGICAYHGSLFRAEKVNGA